MVLLLTVALMLTVPISTTMAGDVYWDDGGTYLINDDTYESDFVHLDFNTVNDPGTHLDLVDGGKVGQLDAWNNATINMTGGWLDYIITYDASTFDMTGGHTDGRAVNNSTMNISGGSFTGFWVWDYSTVNFGGSADGRYFNARDKGTINTSGGILEGIGSIDESIVNVYSGSNMEVIAVTESAIANLHGGLISDYIGADDHSVIYIYGYNMQITNTGGTYGHGQVSGYWIDDTPFNINFYDEETYSHIILVPEPLSICILGFGSLILINRNRNN